MNSAPGPLEGRLVPVGLALLGVYQLAQGLLMVLAPGTFYELIGPFGPQNDHYVRDTATYSLALGAVALVAVRRASWRVPVLVFAVAQFALHSANHLLDIDEADPAFLGPADFVALLVSTVLLAVVLLAAGRGGAER
ncbi:MAG TPA: hypothetical protein VGR10_06915 [Thermoleophilaceae bacterium]|nr:hypothetical protein [Thermoleophilaceae bacterium]